MLERFGGHPDPVTGSDIGPLKSIAVTESFLAHFKVALLTAALISAPWMLYQLWMFVGAGLYDRERAVILKIFPFSIVMFAAGMSFGFFVLVPVGLDFLLSYADPGVIESSITVGSYLSLLFVLLFVMGFVFQIPLVMTVTASVGLIRPQTFRKRRKAFILVAFLLAAMFTPPEYTTQILVAIPMVVLYEIGVLLAEWTVRRKERRLAAEAAGEGEE